MPSDRVLRGTASAVCAFVAAMGVAAVVMFATTPPATAGAAWGDVGLVGEVGNAMIVLTFPLTGLLILRRQPRNTVGLLLVGIGVVWGLSGFADNYATYGLLIAPGSVPWPDVAAALNEASWVPAIGLMGTYLILLFPDGHLPSRRWLPLAVVSAITIVVTTVSLLLSAGELDEAPVPMANPLALESGQPVITVVVFTFFSLLPLCIATSAVSLIVRFRRSRGTERLQMKWLATAGAVVASLFLLTMATGLITEVEGSSALWMSVLQSASILSFVLLPAAIGVAILRHRLYDVDVVIKRTLVFGTLTASLLTTYILLVLMLQLVLDPITNQSDLAVAASTLTVAALFRPLRARIQRIVDRRFFRQRYDATRTLERFAVHLRDELDLDTLGVDLRRVVDETVRPAHVSLWLRP